MPYIGKSPHFGVRNRFIYTATGDETSKSGADDNGATLTFTDGAYVDVYLNGVLLKPDTDYVTTTANTIGSLSALSTSDILEVIVYDVFSVSDTVSAASGGTFQGAVGFNGGVSTALTPSSADGAALGSASLEWSDLYLADSGVIYFGNDQDVTITHDPDDGLIFKSTATADDNPFLLTLQTGETDLAANDVIGKIAFQAPDEATGTDAQLVSAAIQAIAEGDHSSSSNASSLVFMTGASEAAAEKMRLDSHGRLGLNGSSMSSFLSDQFVIQTDDQNAGITVYNTNTAHTGGIVFGDSTSGTARYAGYVQYDHNADDMYFGVETNVIVYFSNSSGHQFYTNTSNQAMNMYNTHNTFTGSLLKLRGNSSNSTDYWYAQGESDSDGTPDRDWRIDGVGEFFSDASAFNTGGGDYGEMFEWKDGNTDDEDRRGITVVLDGNQIKKATSDDDTSKIIGVVSAIPCVVGDNPDSWHGKKLKDDWGNRIKENYTRTEWEEDVVNRFGDTVKETKSYATDCIPKDVTVPDDAKVVSKGDNNVPLTRFKRNPDYDPSKEYINRRDRKEWDVIGLVGKLRIKKGQPTGDRWIKMRDISDTVEEWLVR